MKKHFGKELLQNNYKRYRDWENGKPDGLGSKHRNEDAENLPVREKIWGRTYSVVGDGPLKSFLRSRAGLKWDDVYSEIRSSQKNKEISHILLEELGYLVKTKGIEMREGIPVDIAAKSYVAHPPFFPVYLSCSFYVHPETGILVDSKKEKQEQQKLWEAESKNREENLRRKYRKINDEQFAVYLNGVWQLVTITKKFLHTKGLDSLPKEVVNKVYKDFPFLYQKPSRPSYFWPLFYFDWKTLSKKEIKAYCLEESHENTVTSKGLLRHRSKLQRRRG